MNKLAVLWQAIVDTLDAAGAWIALLPIRLLMAYEFFKAGRAKFGGDNWFGNVQDDFPFPFNVIPVEISWFLATWTELVGGFCLIIGLFTRFWAFSLVILTIVAIFGVHWPEDVSSLAELWNGYRITPQNGSGNFRVPLLFLAMLVPLVLFGGGKLSVDHLLASWYRKKNQNN